MRGRAASISACLALMMVVPAVVPAALAWDENPRLYAVSKAPYWEVGQRNGDLSRLCQLGSFNQKDIGRLYIQYTGERGRGITGIAKRGYNLYDPAGKAQPGVTYHFYADGTSQCQVFEADGGGAPPN